ncbi:MAG TPA: helicase HerA-like domain-containing protein, partial [Thermoleophilia bacterium]|nr:helicase HerA-like domain-containing protein [Thermoleophilia bacterium]
MANRHGLVAGATGTGKTVTLQVLAEAFSRCGVPVFAADIKGDLAGVSQPGGGNPKVDARVEQLGLAPWAFEASPVMFWDVFGEQGHPVRTTVSEVGPLLLSRMLNLNEIQEAVLTVAFRVADDNGLLLLDMDDLRAGLKYVADNAADIGTTYGNVSAASVGAIQRALLNLEEQGGQKLFGEPALDLFDFMQTDADGRGYVNVLAADKLMLSPQVYSTLLLWLLSELFERLPEAGDLPKPKLVFFFDEAHLLFTDSPPALLTKIEQVVRLIRSKGVGVYFVTQNPIDIPDTVLGQLGNKVQHALRAFTPREQKAVKAMAETFRPNPEVDVESAVTDLAVGEALLSLLEADGSPSMVRRSFVVPPHGHIGAIAPEQRQQVVAASLVAGHYEQVVDRESAEEILAARAQA